jgi:hypothetical protein
MKAAGDLAGSIGKLIADGAIGNSDAVIALRVWIQ